MVRELTKCANYIPRNESGWYMWYCARETRIVCSFWKKKNVSVRWGTLKLIRHANSIHRYNRWRDVPINRRDLRSPLWKRRKEVTRSKSEAKRKRGKGTVDKDRGRPEGKTRGGRILIFLCVWIIKKKKAKEPTSTNHIALYRSRD